MVSTHGQLKPAVSELSRYITSAKDQAFAFPPFQCALTGQNKESPRPRTTSERRRGRVGVGGDPMTATRIALLDIAQRCRFVKSFKHRELDFPYPIGTPSQADHFRTFSG